MRGRSLAVVRSQGGPWERVVISPKVAFDVEKRPFYATEDGKGQAVRELFA